MFTAILISTAATVVDDDDDEGYYISSNCTDQQRSCHSLLYYANNVDEYFLDDTVFYFMEGVHILDGPELLVIRDVHNLTLMGLNHRMEEGFHETVRQSTVIISCQHSSSGIAFYNSSMVSLIGITITDCGGYLPVDIVNTVLPFEDMRIFVEYRLATNYLALALAVIHCKNITIREVSVQNSSNYGLFCINALRISISHSSFASNNLAGHTDCTVNSCIGGNALLVYTAFEECRNQFIVYSTVIRYSNFSFGYDNGVYSPGSASGLSITMSQGDNYGVNATLDSLVLYGNTGFTSGNFRYLGSILVPYSSLNVLNCLSVYANAIHPLLRTSDLHLLPGSSFSLYFGYHLRNVGSKNCYEYGTIVSQVPLRVSNSSFLHNIAPNGAGLLLQGFIHILYENSNRFYIIESCEMRNNSGFMGTNLYIILPDADVLVKDTTITQSRRTDLHDGTGSLPSAIMVDRALVTFDNITIADNPVSGMKLLNSQVAFLGRNLFLNNSADNGGGMFVSGSSTVLLQQSTQLVFKWNKAASKGGAIYLDTEPIFVQNLCFIQPFNFANRFLFVNSTVTFDSNVAGVAGSAIYGGFIESCHIAAFDLSNLAPNNTDYLSYVFQFRNQSGPSVITSDPESVHFCNETFIYASLEALNILLLPGQSQNVSIVTVGQGGGISPGVVVFREQKTEGVVERFEQTEKHCTTIQYTPQVNVSATLPTVQVVELAVKFQQNSKRIYFQIKGCPLGFEFSPISRSCECTSQISSGANILCNPVSKSFSHEGDIWMGYLEERQCFVVHSGCSLHHCKTSPVNFTLASTDNQCTLNRSGLLCGGCAEGLSLMLGSDRCGECNNNWLSLLIVFALAGIALIAFITALNLTVSTGSMNGLLFYANIVKINESLFFPQLLFPRIFISWLNLDLGIEVCFFKGMSSYWKTWLQFSFPVYLWFLMIIIIFLSHHSFRVSKLMGRHSVPVLATVLLMSFTKIIRTCINVMKSVSVQCGTQTSVMWFSDATVPYWSNERLVMIIISIGVFFTLAFLFAMFLLCSPFIEKYLSQYACCKWWFKLKPLFDAYSGPYEDKYRMWTGFLLLIRFAYAVIIVSFGSAITIAVLTTTIGLMLGVMALSKGPYRSKLNNFLECFHFINLLFLAGINSTTIASNGLSYISIALVFLAFVFIILPHHFMQTKLFEKMRSYIKLPRLLEKSSKNLRPQVDLVDDRHIVTHNLERMTTVELFNEDGVFVSMKRETLVREGITEV